MRRPFIAVGLALLTLAAGLACGKADLPPPPAPALAPTIPPAAAAVPPPNAVPGRPALTPPPAPAHPHPPLPPRPPATAANPPTGPRPRRVSPDPAPPSLSPNPPPAGKAEMPAAAAADGPSAAAAQGFLQRIALLEPAAAQRIAAMPFLNTLEPADVAALESLAQLAAADRETFGRILAHPSLAGGMDDDTAKVAAVWAGVNQSNPALLPQLLNREGVWLEERTIALPRAGPITLVIIRLTPDQGGSMDLLAAAVRFAADYMGAAFPRRYVALLLADAAPDYSAGANFGTHIAVRPQYDGLAMPAAAGGAAAAGGWAQNGGRALAHEVAHYYWAGQAPWLDEGAAEMLAALFAVARAGGHPQANHYPCAKAAGIRDLAAADYAAGTPGYQCNYALGERLFLDLRQVLGAADFRAGFRRLYRELAAAGGATGIAAVRRAFVGEDLTSMTAAQSRAAAVIARWHKGAAPAAGQWPEPTAAVADLPPPINGRIVRAYLSPTPGGKPSHRFSAAAAGDWAWLNLEYAYHFSGPPQELELEVVEYFADGFAYRRVRDALTLTDRGSGGWRRYSVGPGPGRPWAVGRHWVLVYHQGVKVAAVAYEVTG